MQSTEPILDIVRGLSTVASASIVLNQIQMLWVEFFTSECEHCRGTGIRICTHCGGTKDLRKTPAVLTVRTLELEDCPDAHYPCFYCGDFTKTDYNFDNLDDNENEALDIMDNFKAASAGKIIPHRFKPAAGTVPCEMCMGDPKIRRFTPNLAKIFGLEDNWQFKIHQRIGRTWSGKENRPADRQRLFLEYPSKPEQFPVPRLWEPKSPFIPKSSDDDGEGINISSKDVYTLDDYVFPYIDDSDDELEDP